MTGRPANLPVMTHSRPAFTLIEVVIAATLSTVLLAALLTAVRQVYQAEAVANRRLRNLQTATGLLDAFARDVQAAIRPVPRFDSSDLSRLLGGASGADAAGSSTAATSDVGIDIRRSLLIGTDSSVLVQGEPTLRPATAAADVVAASDAGTLAPESRRVQLLWRASDDGSIEAVREAIVDPVAGTLGPVRTESSGVAVMGFRFFDGVDWVESWDGVAFGLPPVAIEATATVSQPDDAAGDVVTLSRVVVVPTGRYAEPEPDSSGEADGLEMLELGF